MTINTELCRAKTSDGETLHGLLFRPDGASGSEAGPAGIAQALLLVHGVANNFYTGPCTAVGQALAERGHHAFVMNTRGHDWIARSGDGSGFGGASYENFEDCPHDFDAGLALLAERGYRRFVIFGHSLGGVKTVYYQGLRQHQDVAGVISCSAPKQFYSQRLIEQEVFPELLNQAEMLVKQGLEKSFIWAPTSGSNGLFTARTYVSKYGRHEQTDVRGKAAQLGCPFLATAGGAEEAAFHDHARELAAAAKGVWHIVPEARHSYEGHIDELADIVTDWLATLT